MRTRVALVTLALLAVAAPLAALLGAPAESLVGHCGIARGEFENWAFTDWWLPHFAACRLEAHQGRLLPFLHDMLCAPRDLDFGNYLDGLLITQPMKALLGAEAGHNARAAIVLALNAAAAFFACREAVRCAAPDDAPSDGALADAAALVCATALACNPITLWDVTESRYAQALIAPSVAYMGCLLRWIRLQSPRSAVASGVLLALAALDYWFAALFLTPLTLLAPLCVPPPRQRAITGWVLLAGVSALIVSPFAVPFLGVGGGAQVPLGSPFPPLASLAIPAPGVLGPPGPGLVVAQSIDLSDPLRPPMGPALPWPWVACAAVSLVAWRRRRAVAMLLGGSALLWWGLALGPYVRYHGEAVASGSAYALAYQLVPFMWRLHWPARTLPLLAAVLALLTAPGIAALLRRLEHGRAAAAVGLAALSLLSASTQALVPLPVSHVTVPTPYRDGRLGNPQDGVIELSLPLNAATAAWYQTWHGHPLLGSVAYCDTDPDASSAHWTRDPDALCNDPLFTYAAAVREGRPAPAWPAAAAARLAQAGYPWLVVQRTYATQPIAGSAMLADALARALGPPVIDVPEMAAWRLR